MAEEPLPGTRFEKGFAAAKAPTPKRASTKAPSPHSNHATVLKLGAASTMHGGVLRGIILSGEGVNRKTVHNAIKDVLERAADLTEDKGEEYVIAGRSFELCVSLRKYQNRKQRGRAGRHSQGIRLPEKCSRYS